MRRGYRTLSNSRSLGAIEESADLGRDRISGADERRRSSQVGGFIPQESGQAQLAAEPGRR